MYMHFFVSLVDYLYNPLRPTAIQKLLEMIGTVRSYPHLLVATALDSDINQTAGYGWSSEHIRKQMHAYHSVSVACRSAEKRRRRGKTGSIHISILVGHWRLNRS